MIPCIMTNHRVRVIFTYFDRMHKIVMLSRDVTTSCEQREQYLGSNGPNPIVLPQNTKFGLILS